LRSAPGWWTWQRRGSIRRDRPVAACQQPAADHQQPDQEEEFEQRQRGDGDRREHPETGGNGQSGQPAWQGPGGERAEAEQEDEGAVQGSRDGDRRIVDGEERGGGSRVEPVDLQRRQPRRERADLDRERRDREARGRRR
jgi:hypothetical protein